MPVRSAGFERPRAYKKMERETGFEPATSTLARSHSTTELFPLGGTSIIPRVPLSPRGTGMVCDGSLIGPWASGTMRCSSSRNTRIRSAPSPSGKAEVCKTSIPGSNPGGASNLRSRLPTRSVSYGWQATRRLSTVAPKARRWTSATSVRPSSSLMTRAKGAHRSVKRVGGPSRARKRASGGRPGSRSHLPARSVSLAPCDGDCAWSSGRWRRSR